MLKMNNDAKDKNKPKLEMIKFLSSEENSKLTNNEIKGFFELLEYAEDCVKSVERNERRAFAKPVKRTRVDVVNSESTYYKLKHDIKYKDYVGGGELSHSIRILGKSGDDAKTYMVSVSSRNDNKEKTKVVNKAYKRSKAKIPFIDLGGYLVVKEEEGRFKIIQKQEEGSGFFPKCTYHIELIQSPKRILKTFYVCDKKVAQNEIGLTKKYNDKIDSKQETEGFISIYEYPYTTKNRREKSLTLYKVDLFMPDRGSPILKHLAKSTGLTLQERLKLCRKIFVAYQVLEKLQITHNDLHAENILIKNGNIYFIDFGHAADSNKVEFSVVEKEVVQGIFNNGVKCIKHSYWAKVSGYLQCFQTGKCSPQKEHDIYALAMICSRIIAPDLYSYITHSENQPASDFLNQYIAKINSQKMLQAHELLRTEIKKLIVNQIKQEKASVSIDKSTACENELPGLIFKMLSCDVNKRPSLKEIICKIDGVLRLMQMPLAKDTKKDLIKDESHTQSMQTPKDNSLVDIGVSSTNLLANKIKRTEPVENNIRGKEQNIETKRLISLEESVEEKYKKNKKEGMQEAKKLYGWINETGVKKFDSEKLNSIEKKFNPIIDEEILKGGKVKIFADMLFHLNESVISGIQYAASYLVCSKCCLYPDSGRKLTSECKSSMNRNWRSAQYLRNMWWYGRRHGKRKNIVNNNLVIKY